MELPVDVTAEVRMRLRRVAGQVKGVERMLEEGRDCAEVVPQLAAATKALEQAGFRLLTASLTYCIEHPETADADGQGIEALQKMFAKLV